MYSLSCFVSHIPINEGDLVYAFFCCATTSNIENIRVVAHINEFLSPICFPINAKYLGNYELKILDDSYNVEILSRVLGLKVVELEDSVKDLFFGPNKHLMFGDVSRPVKCIFVHKRIYENLVEATDFAAISYTDSFIQLNDHFSSFIDNLLLHRKCLEHLFGIEELSPDEANLSIERFRKRVYPYTLFSKLYFPVGLIHHIRFIYYCAAKGFGLESEIIQEIARDVRSFCAFNNALTQLQIPYALMAEKFHKENEFASYASALHRTSISLLSQKTSKDLTLDDWGFPVHEE